MRKLMGPPGGEVIGVNIRAFADNLQAFQTRPVMQKYGLVDVQPDQWYPLQPLLDGLNELSQCPGMSANLVAIGMEIGMITPVAPHIQNPTLWDVLVNWNDIYQMIHRNGDVGCIACEIVDDKHYKTIHTCLYPDDFNYGIVYGYGRRFLPPGTDFTVFYDPDMKPRDQGGTDATVIHVTWK
ncbi:MAG TPA: hypothetical protein VMT24_14780 [Aggregatilineaceae bacterium]|nr:hypothetical protein [Aggregatilineaceae bacterium]